MTGRGGGAAGRKQIALTEEIYDGQRWRSSWEKQIAFRDEICDGERWRSSWEKK